MKKQFLEAGKIVNTHGVTGDIKVQSWCDTPDVLTEFDTLYLSPEKPVKVKKSYVHKGCVIMHLAGVDTCEDAQALRNQVLYLDRDDIDLPEDLVFIQDMIGLTVYDERTQTIIGTLKEVLTTNPAHDMYVIRRPDAADALIPACEPFLVSVDLAANRLTVRTIEGLLE
ncbi:MAG: 16S rRNA processing protein RimM [Butyricicoccus pullicaecorum]|nr:16S rRNA processing protein RimM [Butyricicoccus pullicaecorum]